MRSIIYLVLLFFISKACTALENNRFVSVVGSATMDTDPTRVHINFDIEATKKSTKEALESAGTLSTEIMKELLGFKDENENLWIKNQDIKTTGFSINPVHRWVRDDSYSSSGRNILVGYRVSTSYSLTMENTGDHTRICSVLDMLGKKDPSNLRDDLETSELLTVVRINGIYFSVDPQTTYDLEVKARKLAVEDAILKAQQLVEASNVRFEDGKFVQRFESVLGKIEDISAQFTAPRPENFLPMSMNMASERSAASDFVPISPGKSTISCSVNTKFRIVDKETI
jgi:uncharacterized protein YggE